MLAYCLFGDALVRTDSVGILARACSVVELSVPAGLVGAAIGEVASHAAGLGAVIGVLTPPAVVATYAAVGAMKEYCMGDNGRPSTAQSCFGLFSCCAQGEAQDTSTQETSPILTV